MHLLSSRGGKKPSPIFNFSSRCFFRTVFYDLSVHFQSPNFTWVEKFNWSCHRTIITTAHNFFLHVCQFVSGCAGEKNIKFFSLLSSKFSLLLWSTDLKTTHDAKPLKHGFCFFLLGCMFVMVEIRRGSKWMSGSKKNYL